jgi:hypothetical protein
MKARESRRPDRRSEPGEVRRIVLSVRQEMSGLFTAFAIPEEETGAILRDAVDRSIQQCHRTERPRQLFLQVLEDRCAGWVAARRAENEADQNAEETEDDDRAPDA